MPDPIRYSELVGINSLLVCEFVGCALGARAGARDGAGDGTGDGTGSEKYVKLSVVIGQPLDKKDC